MSAAPSRPAPWRVALLILPALLSSPPVDGRCAEPHPTLRLEVRSVEVIGPDGELVPGQLAWPGQATLTIFDPRWHATDTGATEGAGTLMMRLENGYVLYQTEAR